MFIVYDNKGNEYQEGKNIEYWIDLPEDIEIKSILIDLPNKNKYIPKFSLSKYEKYYLYNEAVLGPKGFFIEATNICGIKGLFVYEFRIDMNGNITQKAFPYSSLHKKIKNGSFDNGIIRNGICSVD